MWPIHSMLMEVLLVILARNTEQDLLNVAGFMFMSISFFGIGNCHSVQKFLEEERLVMCRERILGMHSSIAYSLAQIAIEIPYIFVLAFIYASITYLAIGFQLSAYKFRWNLGAIFFSLLQYTYFGMFLIHLPSIPQPISLRASSYQDLESLNGGSLGLSMQSLLLNIHIDLEIEAFGERKGVNVFIKDYFGFQHDRLALVAAMLVALLSLL